MSDESSRLSPLLRSNHNEEAYEPIGSSTTASSSPSRNSSQSHGRPVAEGNLASQSSFKTVTPEPDDLRSSLAQQTHTEDEASDTVVHRRNRNTEVSTILTDCAAVILPLTICAVVIYVWHLNELEVGDTLEAWRNVINVVSLAKPQVWQ